jgi:predicted nucleic acid-binding protein
MGVEIVIDTNRYRDFVDGDPDAVTIFRSSPKIFVPFVVAAELRTGFALGAKETGNERIFQQFLHRERVEILLPTLDTTRHYAQLYRQLRVAGTPIPINDLWIAALVVQHDIALYSRDGHFDNLPQLIRIP